MDFRLIVANIEDAGPPFEQVVQAMRFGLAYVNVHTLAHPPGEIR